MARERQDEVVRAPTLVDDPEGSRRIEEVCMGCGDTGAGVREAVTVELGNLPTGGERDRSDARLREGENGRSRDTVRCLSRSMDAGARAESAAALPAAALIRRWGVIVDAGGWSEGYTAAGQPHRTAGAL